MLTLFTTAKPFVGHNAIIQRNALKSWTLLHPDVEVILFGDDDGAAETARELKLRHEPYVARSEYGTKRLDYMFSTARAIARHDILCYINCDIILMDDVLYTGRTIRAALDALFDHGRPARVQLLVLIDRGHRELPIEARYVGRMVQTTSREIIEVKFQEIDGQEKVMLVERVEEAASNA